MRLIDGDKIREAVEICHPYFPCYYHVLSFIDDLQTIDPVRHGYWKYRKGWGRFVCSECSFESDSDSLYCSCCGARMDKEDNGNG